MNVGAWEQTIYCEYSRPPDSWHEIPFLRQECGEFYSGNICTCCLFVARTRVGLRIHHQSLLAAVLTFQSSIRKSQTLSQIRWWRIVARDRLTTQLCALPRRLRYSSPTAVSRLSRVLHNFSAAKSMASWLDPADVRKKDKCIITMFPWLLGSCHVRRFQAEVMKIMIEIVSSS